MRTLKKFGMSRKKANTIEVDGQEVAKTACKRPKLHHVYLKQEK